MMADQRRDLVSRTMKRLTGKELDGYEADFNSFTDLPPRIDPIENIKFLSRISSAYTNSTIWWFGKIWLIYLNKYYQHKLISELISQSSRDEFLHDFSCSSVNGFNSSTSEHLCDRILKHVAVAAPELLQLCRILDHFFRYIILDKSDS